MASSIIVPPGGFAGFAQLTAVGQRSLFPRSSNGTRPRKTRRRPVKAKTRKRRADRKAKRLVKGSAAAKAYMAKIRRMRKK